MPQKQFMIYKEEYGVTHFYEYTSMVGVVVSTTDQAKAKIFENGNDMRRIKNRLNKQKNEWHSKQL